MMRALAAGAAVIVLLGSPALGATEVVVDVHVTETIGTGTWVEFSTDQGSFVALYGTFSDGSLRALFPGSALGSHWVDAHEPHVVVVGESRGAHLERVHAVASPRWFDPLHLWIAGGTTGAVTESAFHTNGAGAVS